MHGTRPRSSKAIASGSTICSILWARTLFAPALDALDLAYAGIARQAELIRSGEVGPVELVELYLGRIERLDPRLNAFRTVFAERALAEARQAEGRVGAGGERPLLGVPVAVKDNVDVAGEVTTMGSRAYGGPAQADAEVVRRL